MSGGWQDLFAMGGHGGYVWAAVGALAVWVAVELGTLRWQQRRARRDIAGRPS